jgi:hypothetical protein
MPDLTPPAEPAEGKDFPIPGDYRFAGYAFRRDADGNIVIPVRGANQPYFWSVRATRVASFDLRAP